MRQEVLAAGHLIETHPAADAQAERKAALKKAPVWVYQWDWISSMADGKFGFHVGGRTQLALSHFAFFK